MVSHHTMLILIMLGCGAVLFAGRAVFAILRMLLSPMGLFGFLFVRSAKRASRR